MGPVWDFVRLRGGAGAPRFLPFTGACFEDFAGAGFDFDLVVADIVAAVNKRMMIDPTHTNEQLPCDPAWIMSKYNCPVRVRTMNKDPD